MYIPALFAETRPPALHALMRERAFATLVTLSDDTANANHLPLLLTDVESTPFGVLQGHLARANPAWLDLQSGRETLAIFHGPQCYITPSWYPTKAATGKVVPTWNYVVVHAYGIPRVIEDAAWLRAHLTELTRRHEANRPDPWAFADAPPEYLDHLLRGVVGIEITITRLLGKSKLSQNQPAENRAGVLAGLKDQGTPQALEMAAWMERPNSGE